MEPGTLQHRAHRAPSPSLFDLDASHDPQRRLGVVDGLVSVTQRAWGLASVQRRMVH